MRDFEMKIAGARLIVSLLVLALMMSGGFVYADEPENPDDFPTLTAIEQTIIPAFDAVDVAGRLLGVTVPEDETPSPPERVIGELEGFWASNSYTMETFPVPAELRAIGQHNYIWIERGTGVSDEQAWAISQAFDERIYHQVRDLWGSEDTPGIDGDPRLHILFATGLGFGTGAYFAQRHTYPDAVISASNEREMFFVNLSAFGTNIATPNMESTLAHEFQHMIQFNVNPNEDTWLNEGFSTFTEYYLGYTSPYRYPAAFFADVNNQLNTFGLSATNRSADYGGAFMFTTYFYQRWGEDGIRTLGAITSSNGLARVSAALAQLGGDDVDTFFADWVLANYIQDDRVEDGRYSYPADLPMSRPNPINPRFDGTVYTAQMTGNQYGTRYFALNGLDGARKLGIALDMPLTVGLVPADAYSGDFMWYSNRADTSNMTLTRAFDLRDVDSATLTFQAWYAIEELWDFVYVVASADGGATWDFLESPQMTRDDPFGNNYGIGYTGYSDGWIEQSISLDDYAGGEVLIRFKHLTDDAVNEPGMVIDDIAIMEIDYFADFETDGGGWEADGWIRIDNALPQRAWVQVIEYAGERVNAITRYQFPTDDLTLTLAEGTTDAIIAVSPFAPVTTIPAVYTLRVDVVD